MIDRNNYYHFGTILKLHGFSGRLVLKVLSSRKPKLKKTEPVFLDLDGILVPFFLKEFEFTSDYTCLLLLEDVETEFLANELLGVNIYLHVSQKPESNSIQEDLSLLIGFKLFDDQKGYIGEIYEVIEIPQNHLFLVKEKNDEYLIPVNRDFIIRIDTPKKEIHMELPDGLLDI
jgi:16S rRNA processing protein RimM